MSQYKTNQASIHPAIRKAARLWLPAAFVLPLLLVFAAVPAKADTTEQAWAKIKAAIQCTDAKTCTDAAEAKMIFDAGQAAINQDKKAGKTIKGNAGLNGFSPSGGIPVEFLVPGTLATLTFEWLDPQTLLATTGPAIAFVSYAYSQTPDVPTSFTPLGTSTNPLTDFALQYSAFSTEEAIVATPFDASGNPIFIADVDGIGNLAPGTVVQLVSPEPATLLLFGSSLLGLTAAMSARRRRKPSSR